MRFSLFYELQLPRPWDQDSEQRLLDEALEQIELADELGFHAAWGVEHHFLEEYAHSSASAVWLAAAAARTKRIRLGLGIMPLPPGYQHPARVAEAAATLDLVSHGRVELGTGETSSEIELGGFGVPRAAKRAQWDESLDVLTRMMVEEPFTGHAGDALEIPARNVVPKPRQKPHPPLWVACSQRETIRLAAAKGLGALSFSFAEPEEARAWVDEYYEIVASDRCVPAGFSANPNFAIATPMMVHRDERKAIRRGLDGAHFFGYALAHYYAFGDHRPGFTDVHSEFAARRGEVGFAGRDKTGGALNSARGAIGTPEQVADFARRYEAAGVDEILLAVQVGANKHKHIIESLELFAEQVMPEFAKRRPDRESAKAARLAAPVSAALARRPAARKGDPEYVVTPSVASAGALRSATSNGHVPGRIESLRAAVGARGTDAVRSFVKSSPDSRLERIGGSDFAIRQLFRAMERRYVPENARGFAGDIQYELRHADHTVTTWTLTLDDTAARSWPGASADPAVVLAANVPDFLRIAGGDLPAAKALLTGRLTVHGDLMVAARMGEMFGQPSPF